ncbi:hypothetical protein [Rhizobium mesosinicum]|uniref:Restriction endonuclease type IV Mrr domain-containing protein n=1 Tax=Rhizobium mesosinicum TaxID=335017 RepID=A0ABS7GRE5_9HYPH|nr:hypothetical protein [Rhizobium mesosinicum]MBW9052257.1 hypothetical protein [Rhizobium mesosinicum]
MGRMKDLAIESWNQQNQFIDIVANILTHSGYTIEDRDDPDLTDPFDRLPYDLLIKRKDGKSFAVEVKTYRSERVDRHLLWNALSTLGRKVKAKGGIGGMILIMTGDLPASEPTRFGSMDGVEYEIMSRSTLLDLVKDRDDLLDDLSEILDEVRDNPIDVVTPPPHVPSTPAPPRSGFDVAGAIEKIKACPPSNGAAFETVCIEAIKGLFDSEFNRWSTQSRVERGFHRIDLLGQLNPKNDFWQGMRFDFRSRYVVFEFKNYSAAISQDEIYSTEKYLFAGALRMVAVVIGRNGEDDGAKRARHGALREHGKLIIFLSEDELIEMLQRFSEGDDPHEVLIDNLYNMLREIGR